MEGELLHLLWAPVLGMGAGVLYDALRPLRRASTPFWAAVLDIVFCVLSASAVFCYAMGARSGTLGLWELTAALIGLLLYSHFFSRQVFDFFAGVLAALLKTMRFLLNSVRKAAISIKKLFQKVRECFIIKK